MRSGDSCSLLLAPYGSMLSKIWPKSCRELSSPTSPPRSFFFFSFLFFHSMKPLPIHTKSNHEAEITLRSLSRAQNPQTGLTNLDNWVRGWYEFDVNLGLDMQEGAIAEHCGEVGGLGIP